MKANTLALIGALSIAQLASGTYFECFTIIQPAQAEYPVTTLQWENMAINATKIEASGILWDAKAEHFLIVSDETYKKQPGVLVLENNGDFRAVLAMQQDTLINDLESISTDGDFIYILNSFNVKDPSKTKLSRGTGKLIRFKYQHDHVTEQQEVNLEEVLTKLVNEQPTSRLALLLSDAIKNQSINIEAHLVLDNNLYLGFKTPLENARETVFVKLSNLAGIFNGQHSSAEIVLTLALPKPETGKPTRLSDMALAGNDLFLLSADKGNSKNSYLWRYTLGSKQAELLKTFSDLQAEGITYVPALSLLVVVFDEGSAKASKYQLLPLSEF
jgi:hypothetical protein